ncbi:hypothetical protein MY11210_006746 [Beauveria gryllotalpidicola]
MSPTLDNKESALLSETEKLLNGWKHPDPYVPPTAPGGSKYERNLPSPVLDRKSTIMENGVALQFTDELTPVPPHPANGH